MEGRTTGSTRANAHSSRSHAVFMLRMEATWHDIDDGHGSSGAKSCTSRMHLVDLAGDCRKMLVRQVTSDCKCVTPHLPAPNAQLTPQLFRSGFYLLSACKRQRPCADVRSNCSRAYGALQSGQVFLQRFALSSAVDRTAARGHGRSSCTLPPSPHTIPSVPRVRARRRNWRGGRPTARGLRHQQQPVRAVRGHHAADGGAAPAA